VELYREGSYEGALAEFRKAYQISPSYRVLYNIAQTQYALHDFVSAYRSLKQYVAEGGAEIPADRRAQVDDMSAKLAERIARLQIGADADGADIRIDDVSVGKSPLEEAILVNVGTHKVSAVKAGSPEAVRVITVAGKETLKVGLHLDAPEVLSPVRAPSTQRVPMVVKTETKGPPSRAGLIVSLTTTAVLAVGTGVFGYQALQAQDDFKKQLNVYPNTKAKIEDARTKSKNYGYITDAFGAATLLSGGAAIYFWLTSAGPTPQPAKSAKATVLGLAPTVGGMVLQGSF
jgi:tetratricopeptide (TPR) repeat protein